MMHSLVLAIQPDREQAQQLAAVIDGRLNAQLVLAESAAAAFAALEGRVPDLILTPALLSARDETAIAERLRELGDAAAHVQTVTVPRLDAAPAATARRGLLDRFRRTRSDVASTIGCEPDVFAQQVAAYLQRAAAERGAAVADAPAQPTVSQPPTDLVPPAAQPLTESIAEPRLEDLHVEAQLQPYALGCPELSNAIELSEPDAVGVFDLLVTSPAVEIREDIREEEPATGAIAMPRGVAEVDLAPIPTVLSIEPEVEAAVVAGQSHTIAAELETAIVTPLIEDAVPASVVVEPEPTFAIEPDPPVIAIQPTAAVVAIEAAPSVVAIDPIRVARSADEAPLEYERAEVIPVALAEPAPALVELPSIVPTFSIEFEPETVAVADTVETLPAEPEPAIFTQPIEADAPAPVVTERMFAIEPDSPVVAIEPDLPVVGIEPDLSVVAIEPDVPSMAMEPEAPVVALEAASPLAAMAPIVERESAKEPSPEYHDQIAAADPDHSLFAVELPDVLLEEDFFSVDQIEAALRVIPELDEEPPRVEVALPAASPIALLDDAADALPVEEPIAAAAEPILPAEAVQYDPLFDLSELGLELLTVDEAPARATENTVAAAAPALDDDVAIVVDETIGENDLSAILEELRTIDAAMAASQSVVFESPKRSTTPAAAPSGRQRAPRERRPARPIPEQPENAPLQDEWGLFDPEQCGFAALVAKLNEVTEHEDAQRRARSATRVISVG